MAVRGTGTPGVPLDIFPSAAYRPLPMQNSIPSIPSRPALAAAILFAAVAVVLFLLDVRTGLQRAPGYDFRLRYHEVECIRKGIDPYDVVSGAVPTDEYALFCNPAIDRGAKAIHVYSPWGYTFILPFTFLPIRPAGILYTLLSAAALLAVSAWVFRAGFALRGSLCDALFAAAAVLLPGNPAWEVLVYANFGALHALAILLLAIALEARRDILAGFCWAFLMIKPQIGLLFAIPLLLDRRWLVAGTAVAVCLAAAVPPALMCGRSVPELILEVPRALAFVAEENGTMLIPSQVFAALDGHMSLQLLGHISMAIGAVICFVLVWRVRNARSWFVRLAPVAACSVLWSYCKPHDRVVLWLPLALMALSALESRKPRDIVLCLVACALAAWPFGPSTSTATKLVRRVSLAVFLAFCWLLPRRSPFPDPTPCHAGTSRMSGKRIPRR